MLLLTAVDDSDNEDDEKTMVMMTKTTATTMTITALRMIQITLISLDWRSNIGKIYLFESPLQEISSERTGVVFLLLKSVFS